MADLWDQLYDAEVLLRKAEQDGDTDGAEILHQRIARIEAQIHAQA